jgi:hypothetical protein
VVTDWATVSELGTAAGTLVLAVATFAAVRSSNRSARLAERALLAGLRPLLLPSRLEDPPEKVGFQDDHWLRVPGGMAIADITDNIIYLAMAVRNVGTGLAVLNGWRFHPERLSGPAPAPDPDLFRRLNRDLYIPAGDRGFWQGAFRDPAEPDFALARDAIAAGNVFSIDVLYGDGEGGQRTITRFTVIESRDGNWITAVSHHWNLDRPDPR